MDEIIDSHTHLWKCEGDYFDWIEESSVIRRDFFINDLQEILHTCQVSGSILVQAIPQLDETQWLLDVAEQAPEIRGVIGWCDVSAGEKIHSDIDIFLKQSPLLKGIRYMSQGLPCEHLYEPAFIDGVREIGKAGLVYELLITDSQLSAAQKLIDACPDVTFVIEHMAKPCIKDRQIENWQKHITSIATHYQNVFCKVSGMVTEAEINHWKNDDLTPYLDTIFECFGMQRTVFGSDWPVLLLASSYQHWLDVLNEYFQQSQIKQTQGFFADNAKQIYGLA